MSSYAVDSIRQPMTATGIVDAVTEWEETPEGKRRPSEKQARNPNTGMPLWAVEVLYVQSAFGRASTMTAKVTVEAVEEPKPAPLTPVAFAGLRVETRISKAGGFTEYWSADGLVEPTKAAALPGPRPSGEKAA
jgi:hypothetical protein